MKRAILYIRVSTDEQADKGYSLQHQEERLRKYCEINNIEPIQLFKEDYSAKNFNRPIFRKLLEYAKANKKNIDCLLFVKWDRFSRNIGESYKMLSILRELNIESFAIEQPLDLSVPQNKSMLALYLSMPEVENDVRSQNVYNGMRRAKKAGRWMATAPKGYSNRKDEHKKWIEPNKDAKYIKETFEQFATGLYTQNEVRKMLNEKEIRYSKQQFSKMLRNVAYIGKIHIPAFKDEEEQIAYGLHQPIISEDVFSKVQRLLKDRKIKNNKKNTYSKTREELPLRGFLICTKCGGKLTGYLAKKRFPYYECKNCQNKQLFNATKTNNEFIKMLNKMQIREDVQKLYLVIVKDILKGNEQERKNEIAKYNLEISKLQTRIKGLQDKFADDLISVSDYKDMKNRYEKNINDLIMKRTELSMVKSDFEKYFQYGFYLIKDISKYYQKSNVEVKQKIVGSIYPEYLYYDGKKFRTPKINEALSLIINSSNAFKTSINKKGTKTNNLSLMVNPAGFEPATS